MTDENKALFFEHAQTTIPREACALIVVFKGKEKLFICRNTAFLETDFSIHPDDYIAAANLGEIVAVVHSHVGTPAIPTQADLVSCSRSNLKWYILAALTGEWCEFFPSDYKAPLVGRVWSHGILDCFSIIRDYYKEILNVDLPDFNRDFQWWKTGQNLYLENFAKAGFFEVSIDDIQKHDVILMRIESSVINHGAVYLGDGLFLQHLENRLSSRHFSIAPKN